MNKLCPFLLIILFIAVACKNETGNNNVNIPEVDSVDIKINNGPKEVIEIFTPIQEAIYTLGDSIYFDLNLKGSTKPDSVHIKVNNRIICSWKEQPYRLTWVESGLKVGSNSFTAYAYKDGTKIAQKSVRTKFKSDIVPVEYIAQVVNEFPHDVKAYTQGFIYLDGYIYEGTGQKGHSSIQKYTLEDHNIVQSYNNQSDVFGEGIVIVDDKLIQLTWRSGVGFIYDKKTFKRLSKFDFQTEGWGLTYDGNQLIMSDGSNYLYYLETSVFTKTGQFEVYDNKGHVQFLNELEYIEGKIYANVYGKDEIVIVDPSTGKVTGRILAASIRPEGIPFNTDYALNGIAWDKENNRLLVTGKYWPKIFEIEIVKK